MVGADEAAARALLRVRPALVPSNGNPTAAGKRHPQRPAPRYTPLMFTGPRIVIPFAHVRADQNPNVVRLRGHDQQAAYARGTAVTFASLRRWNPDIALTYFTNGPVHRLLSEILRDCDVEVTTAEFDCYPPEGFMTAFSGCLYLMDAARRYRNEDVLYLDPDVVCIGALHEMFTDLGENVGALPMHFPLKEAVNGVSGEQARGIQKAAGWANFDGFVGGEALWVPASRADGLWGAVERTYAFSIDQFKAALDHYSTEEHLLSSVLSGSPYSSIEPYVRRIWTTSRYRTVDGTEADLRLWHLPAEKDRGFKSIYDAAKDRASWFWTVPRPEFIQHAGAHMSLWRRPPRKLARDSLGQVANTLERAASRWHQPVRR